MSLMGAFTSAATKAARKTREIAEDKRPSTKELLAKEGLTKSEPVPVDKGPRSQIENPNMPQMPALSDQHLQNLQTRGAELDSRGSDLRQSMSNAEDQYDRDLAQPMPSLSQEMAYQPRPKKEMIDQALLSAIAYNLGVRPEYIQDAYNRHKVARQAEIEERNKMALMDYQTRMQQRDAALKRDENAISRGIRSINDTEMQIDRNNSLISRATADANRTKLGIFKQESANMATYMKIDPWTRYQQIIQIGGDANDAREYAIAPFMKMKADIKNIESLIKNRETNTVLRRMGLEYQSKYNNERISIMERQLKQDFEKFAQSMGLQKEGMQIRRDSLQWEKDKHSMEMQFKLSDAGKKQVAELDKMIADIGQKLSGLEAEASYWSSQKAKSKDAMQKYRDSQAALESARAQKSYLEGLKKSITNGTFNAQTIEDMRRKYPSLFLNDYGELTDVYEDTGNQEYAPGGPVAPMGVGGLSGQIGR